MGGEIVPAVTAVWTRVVTDVDEGRRSMSMLIVVSGGCYDRGMEVVFDKEVVEVGFEF